jgi:hypothetical protein
MFCHTTNMPVQTSLTISSCAPFALQLMAKGSIVRNLTVPETPLEQWPAKRAPGGVALSLHHGSGARRPLSSPRINEQRVADLAHEILAAAIGLAAMLEVAQQIASAQRKGTVAGGPGNA